MMICRACFVIVNILTKHNAENAEHLLKLNLKRCLNLKRETSTSLNLNLKRETSTSLNRKTFRKKKTKMITTSIMGVMITKSMITTSMMDIMDIIIKRIMGMVGILVGIMGMMGIIEEDLLKWRQPTKMPS